MAINTHFRTHLQVERAPFDLAHSHRVFVMGSCFARHIGDRLLLRKFDAMVNPFGTVYNPVSMAKQMDEKWLRIPTSESELFEQQDVWRHWDLHGDFSGTDRAALARAIAEKQAETDQFLQHADRLLLTLGSAQAFRLLSSGEIVANCHKTPASAFEELRLGVDEVTDALASTLSRLSTVNPALKVVLTVSPVRHLRGGAVANQRSKSVLVLACAELERRFDFVYYFPAYELLLDDLRDYRFYADDMTHPSELAVEYIWEQFMGACFDEKTRQLCRRVERLQAAAQHRTFHPDSAAHRAFVAKQIEEISALKAIYPHFDFSEESKSFES